MSVVDSSIGIKVESTFGQAVTVDRFPEFISESMQFQNTFAQSEGRRVGSRMDRSAGRVLEKVNAGGQIVLEARTKGAGVWLNAALGAVTSNETGDSGVYLQVHTPATTGPAPSYTIQKGLPPVGGGSTQAFTFPGSVCTQMELDFTSAILKLATDWMSREVVTSEAYASPSYATGDEPFALVHGSIIVGASVTKPTTSALATTEGSIAANVKSGKVTINNNLDSEGHNLGYQGKRSRTAERGALAVTGSLDVEFSGTTLRDALLNQTRLSLLLEFEHPSTIGASSHPVLQVYIPSIVFEDGLPQSNGTSPIMTTMNFKALDSLAASTKEIYICYQTTDTAI